MKVFINFRTIDGPTGGGNQFLRALSRELACRGVLAPSVREADVVLLNSFQFIEDLVRYRDLLETRTVIHRIDGPEILRDPRLWFRDAITRYVNRFMADGTVFQSQWSQEANVHRGIGTPFMTHILNAPDPEIFNARGREAFTPGRKVRVIGVSWSSNRGKGFDAYQWLDEHLDFSRYEMTFIGNAPVRFRNIRTRDPLTSGELAVALRAHDIYITPSRNEPCSNALIEALHCGLPAVALRSGSHAQIIGRAGELFDRHEEAPALLDKVAGAHARYAAQIAVPSIKDVADQYMGFISRVVDQAGPRRSRSAAGYLGLAVVLNYATLWEKALWGYDRVRRSLSG